jgi:hypothetical protein
MDRVRREIEKSYGRVFSFAGDGLMAEFPSAVEALKCALRIQAETAKREASSAIRNTSNSSNLRCLIASLVAQGEMDEAKHFAAQLIDLSPDYTVSTFRAPTPLSGAVADRFAERLRRAGLPA